MAKVLQEKPQQCSNSDIESQLLEAAKSGDIDVVKVCNVELYLYVAYRKCTYYM